MKNSVSMVYVLARAVSLFGVISWIVHRGEAAYTHQIILKQIRLVIVGGFLIPKMNQ